MPTLAADTIGTRTVSRGAVSQPTGSLKWEEPGTSQIRTLQGILSFLEQRYILRDPEAISHFLKENEQSDLLRFLIAAFPRITAYIPNSRLFLEVIHGTSKSGGNQFHISVATDLERLILGEQLDYLKQHWLSDFPGAQGKVDLDIEPLSQSTSTKAPTRGAEDEDEEISANLTQLLEAMKLMDDEVLWKIAQQNILVQKAHEGLHQLKIKRQQKGLTKREEQEEDKLLQQEDVGILIRSQALALLKQRGHNIDALLAQP